MTEIPRDIQSSGTAAQFRRSLGAAGDHQLFCEIFILRCLDLKELAVFPDAVRQLTAEHLHAITCTREAQHVQNGTRLIGDRIASAFAVLSRQQSQTGEITAQRVGVEFPQQLFRLI